MKQYIYIYKWLHMARLPWKKNLSPSGTEEKNNNPFTFHARITSPVGKCCCIENTLINLKGHKFLQISEMSTWWLKTKHYNPQKSTPTSTLPGHQLTFHGPARTGGSSAALGGFLVDSRWSCSLGLLQGKTSGSFSSGPGWCDMFHQFFAFVLKSIEVQR